MLNVCVGLLFQFGITHIVIVDGGGNSCYCTDAPDIVFSQFAPTLQKHQMEGLFGVRGAGAVEEDLRNIDMCLCLVATCLLVQKMKKITLLLRI